MGSFVCDTCQDTIKKGKVKTHVYNCNMYTISCVDCGKTFTIKTYNLHNQCMTETEKYAGALANERVKKQASEIKIDDIKVLSKKIKKEKKKKKKTNKKSKSHGLIK
eukprot:NODE_141_length_15967_cov_0.946118.p12 type:complete len:107 gc:universal NODE_141_length_15967_cov_0.946118:12106-12426(+)